MDRRRATWKKVDAISYQHAPSGNLIVKMADGTWSICTGPVENISIGLAHWVSHKYRTLRDAKSSVGVRYHSSKRDAAATGYWAGIRSGDANEA